MLCLFFPCTRCLVAHTRPDVQNLFPIVQGGLDEAKRIECAHELMERDVPGFAVGGLSGGEAKDDFWRMVRETERVADEAFKK